MPKKKRTRKDKIQTDIRRQSPSTTDLPKKSATVIRENEEVSTATKPSIGTFSLPTEYASNNRKNLVSKPVTPEKTVAIDTNSYSYLRGDLLKTVFLTIVIVAGELLIYFTMMK